MLKLALTLSALLLISFEAQALPIVEADAFVAGDEKAVRETDTGLIWMDFGVNSHETYNDVIGKLDTDYKGWRLPTSSEVRHLWINIFSDMNGFGIDGNLGLAGGMDSRAAFKAVLDIFGYNKIDTFTINDGTVSETWPVYWSFGVSGSDSVQPDVFMFWSPIDDIHEDTAVYLKISEGMDLSNLNGTLLVKIEKASLPEPSPIIILLLGITLIGFRFRSK